MLQASPNDGNLLSLRFTSPLSQPYRLCLIFESNHALESLQECCEGAGFQEQLDLFYPPKFDVLSGRYLLIIQITFRSGVPVVPAIRVIYSKVLSLRPCVMVVHDMRATYSRMGAVCSAASELAEPPPACHFPQPPSPDAHRSGVHGNEESTPSFVQVRQ